MFYTCNVHVKCLYMYVWSYFLKLYYSEELYNIIIDGIIQGKRLQGVLETPIMGQIKNKTGDKTFKGMKEKANDYVEWRIGIVDQRTGRKNKNVH